MVFTFNLSRLVSSILLILMALNTFFIPANAFWYNSVTPKNSSHLTMNSIPDINPNYVSGTELSRPNMSDSSFSSNQNQSLNYNSGFSVNSSSQILINSTNNDPHILTMSSNSVNSIQSNYFSDPFNFSTEFIDIDANQKYDYLAFSFYINIFTFDNYRININAYSFNTSASRGYNYTIMPLQFGIQKVSLLFPYLNYYRDNFTSYSFNYLSIQNSNSLLYSNSSILAISKSISYTELEPRAIFFTGVASFIPWNKIPENSFTTQYEYINASIEVNITKSGNYDVAGILQVQELGLQYGYYFYHIGSSLKGVITVNLTFTSYLVQKYFNYTLSMNDLHIDLNNVRLESIAEISALQIHPNTYSPDQFDPSFEVISIWDQPIDYDNNGLMDAIGLKIKINTTEILGNTWIDLLLANSTGTFIEKDFFYSFNSIGLLTFNITITVDEIYLTQLYDIVKIAALTIYDQSPWDYLFIGRNISLSQNYSVLTMDKPSISILDKQAYFEDANGDGLNEFQVLNITIQSKNYFSGRLDFNFGISWSGGGSTGLPFSYYFIINNETKSFIIKRSLQSYVYFQNYLNGDFQSNITLDINNFHFKNMTANSDLFTNYLFIKYPTIKYSEFNIHQLSLAINQVTFLDLNNDGLYDTLNISVNIFSIRDMMSKIQMNIPSAFINYWTMLIQKGNNTYSLMMPMVQSYWYLGSSNYSFKFYSIQELVYTTIFNYA